MTNIAAGIAVQLAALIGARRARRRQQPTVVAGFTIAPNTYLARAANGLHGPEAQRAAIRELECLAWFEQQMREVQP